VQKKPGVPLLSRSQCSDTPAGHSGSVTLETVRQCTFGRHGTWQRRCVTMYGGTCFLFFNELGLSLRNHTPLGFGKCTWADLLRSAGRNVRPTKCLHRGGAERRWPMPRLPNNPDRDFSASQSEDDINADIAELFASRPLGIVELFVDPIVRMRIGSLITEAMNRPTRSRRPRSAQ
jgi:hypothetical protein